MRILRKDEIVRLWLAKYCDRAGQVRLYWVGDALHGEILQSYYGVGGGAWKWRPIGQSKYNYFNTDYVFGEFTEHNGHIFRDDVLVYKGIL